MTTDSRRLALSASPGHSRARRYWRNTHLCIALLVGVVIATLGLSGAALVLKGTLLRHDFGAATFDLAAAPSTQWVAVDDWVAQARAHYPQIRFVANVTAPGASPLATQAALITAVLQDGGYGFVTVDPRTGRPLGFFRYGEGWLFNILDFHRHLLLPESAEEVGEQLVAGSGILLLVSIGSGLYLWWPRGTGWRSALRVQRGKLLWRSLHASSAVWAALPLLLIAISGVMLAKPAWVAGLTTPHASLPTSRTGTPCRPLAGYAAAIETTLHNVGGRRFTSIAPLPDGSAYVVQIEGSHRSDHETGSVRIDTRCATVTPLAPEASARSATAQALHARLLMGWPGQILVFATGLMLPFLYGTGLWVWWNKRRRAEPTP